MASAFLGGGLPAFADNVANRVSVDVDQPSSILQYPITLADMMAGQDVASNNYRIRGAVEISANGIRDNTYISVNTIKLMLRQGSDSFAVSLKGTIGGVPPSTTPTRVTFSGKKATIDLIGDIDESTLSETTTNGNYSGVLIITAIIL